jgi:hypothetical protein
MQLVLRPSHPSFGWRAALLRPTRGPPKERSNEVLGRFRQKCGGVPQPWFQERLKTRHNVSCVLPARCAIRALAHPARVRQNARAFWRYHLVVPAEAVRPAAVESASPCPRWVTRGHGFGCELPQPGRRGVRRTASSTTQRPGFVPFVPYCGFQGRFACLN